MKDFLNIDAFFKHIDKSKFTTSIDKLTFLKIFCLWLTTIIFFGLIYHFVQSDNSFLYYFPTSSTVDKLSDTIYFSFVTATTAGFGIFAPSGILKFVAIVQVVIGLLFIAIVTSKLVSIKQDTILNELYELSFTEKINKLRSSLLLFRQNLDRIISKIEDGVIKRRELSDTSIHLSSFDDILREVYVITSKTNIRNAFIKNLDPVNTELIFNSIMNSFEKVHELLGVINENKVVIKNAPIKELTETCINSNEELFNLLNLYIKIRKETITDLNTRKNEVMNRINLELNELLKPESTQENKPTIQA